MRMNLARFVLTISVFAAVYFGMGHFIYARLAAGLFEDGRHAAPLRIFLFLGSLTFFLGMFYRAYPPLFAILPFGNIWLGLTSIAFTALVLKLPLDYVFPGLVRPMTLGAVALILAVSSYSLYNAAGPVRVRKMDLRSDKLPSAGNIRLVQVSDLHLSRLKTPSRLASVVSLVNSLSADAIVVTGDMIDDDMAGLRDFVPVMKGFRAKYGVFAVAGNHDHYAGINNMYEFERAAGLRILTNEMVNIGGMVNLLGVDDEDPEIISHYRPFLEKTLKGNSLPVVLLKHRPTFFDEAEESGVFLQLSGHVHAGQIPPLDLIVRLIFAYPYGLYKRGESYIYTTCGTSTWGPPMRLFSHSEVAVINISR